jgi:hypothetical protein
MRLPLVCVLLVVERIPDGVETVHATQAIEFVAIVARERVDLVRHLLLFNNDHALSPFFL